MLDDFYLPSRQRLRVEYSGMDHPDYCVDRKHFDQYPWPVSYEYNSRGFRDAEWPDDPAAAVWCIGDSFTVGLGAPREHAWPWLLQTQLGHRAVNASLDGASNAWIARRARQVIDELAPPVVIIQWSYTNRRESSDTTLDDEQRRIWTTRTTDLEDLEHTLAAIAQVEQDRAATRIIHSFIPNFVNNEHRQVSSLAITQHCPEHIAEIQQLDRARDGHHYDRLTAQSFVDQVCQRLR